jgi:hypothetical protein
MAGMVPLDLTKAFEVTSHNILLKKLIYYAFGNVIKWFDSYLSGGIGQDM